MSEHWTIEQGLVEMDFVLYAVRVLACIKRGDMENTGGIPKLGVEGIPIMKS